MASRPTQPQPTISNHPVHPHCTLVLQIYGGRSFSCDVCGSDLAGKQGYRCTAHDFDVHLTCLPNTGAAAAAAAARAPQAPRVSQQQGPRPAGRPPVRPQFQPTLSFPVAPQFHYGAQPSVNPAPPPTNQGYTTSADRSVPPQISYDYQQPQNIPSTYRYEDEEHDDAYDDDEYFDDDY